MKHFSMYIYVSIILFFFGLMMIFLGLNFMFNDMIYLLDWELISVNSTLITFTLIFDWMSMMFSGCVFFISSMVICYSHSYMYDDMYKIRFLYLVIMFIFSMFMLIMSPNLISILIGWDGLGLVSYCLVIYFQNYKSYNAGALTILTNRLGDVAILLSIAWMMNYGSWHYFYYLINNFDWVIYMVYLLILAGFTKSAQIPFSSWLPAAMAAPTPVSALVHSSTLVTAGVYLLIRFSDLLSLFNCNFFLIISMMTMFMSGLGANFEFDLKKIIALSTLSQLGLMMTILFLGYPIFSFFHLLTHAFFKALLFLCAGLIIHVMNNTQDIRFMGGLMNYLPMTITCFLISNLALCGFPYLSGFYSKDLILEMFSFGSTNFFIYLIMYISVGLTVSYSVRLAYYVLITAPNTYSCQSYYEDFYMNFSMIFLVLMAVVSGSMISWLIFFTPVFLMLSFCMKIVTIVVIFLSTIFGLKFSEFSKNFNYYYVNNYLMVNFFGSMWFMPNYSTYLSSKIFNNFSFYSFKNFEAGWGETTFSKLSFFFLVVLSKLSELFYINNLKVYMFTFFLFIFIFLVN
uniref:NADH-ubiquinone oxidoreductase chain 5 n=1 Tax=Haloveloides sundaensis TaxID=3095933 RepID=A0AB38Z6V3_9HEMI|nr:NADH dehydrogenase subunit 5 [Haloveloides sundaensis]WPW47172.1 NADH dehydrogenase subunit 5 [Haloveloides sundaensis]